MTVWVVLAMGCEPRSVLTLRFDRPPSDATSIEVVLTSPMRGFGGTRAVAGGIEVDYPGDGSIVVRVGRRDRVTLGMKVDQTLELRGVARTKGGSEEREVLAMVVLSPEEDATLAFDFGEGSSDAGIDQDGGAWDMGGLVDQGGMGDGASDLGPPSVACNFLGSVVASKAGAVGGVTLGAVMGTSGPLYGLAWTVTGSRIDYNVVDSAGNIQLGSDLTVVPAATDVSYKNPPRLARTGAYLALAYGLKNGAGFAPTTVELRVLDPKTGALAAGPEPGVGASATSPPQVGGVVANGAGTLVATVSRPDVVGGDQAILNVFAFNAGGVVLARTGFKDSLSDLSQTWVASIGWTQIASGSLFGVAHLDGTSVSDGKLTVVDGSLMGATTYTFTQAGDSPQVSLLGSGVSVAGANGKLAVAWTDRQANPSSMEIFLTTVDALTGQLGPHVQVSTSSLSLKKFPQLVFDGQVFIVTWLEESAVTTGPVWMRRYDTNLSPLDVARDLSTGAASTVVTGEIGLATAQPNQYGVAMNMLNDFKFFTHASCAGP